ncbi:M20 family metallopeptidase [Ammoniphilus sp. CFH 90114]|uniref:M20 family metallopeptidase n=1 Tax=Ammoniphilus sp. CFH 90114 TaxID=2493665 RepID=UPI00100FAE23|nr:M20 family metallopeptidase [Ammoniphilus sp. CFH 90114]RXT08951.1 M20 family peptidase [Ammoniphilus sp. CFH 90114]
MALLSHIKKELPQFLNLLEESVNMDSPSKEKEQNDQVAQWYATQFESIVGGRSEIIQNQDYGNIVRCTFGQGSKQILIMGHYDTVWPMGEATKRPFSIKENKAYGPGVYDMKAGLLQAFFALKALRDLDLFPVDTQVVLFINSDEEIGSPSSRKWIEEEAKRSHVCFVLEPPLEPLGALKTWRKGSGRFYLTVKGISAHAGVNPESGVSAIEELSHQVLRIHSFTDYANGTTLNVGLIKGGIGANVVAESAEAEIDVRIKSIEQMKKIEEELLHLQPVLKDTELSIKGGFIRPPMERTEGVGLLVSQAKKLGKLLDLDLQEQGTGGVSDGNFTAACGIPTLDGLGARGGYAHSPHEFVDIDQIPVRTALLALLIQELEF